MSSFLSREISYEGKEISFLTQHGKESLLAPLFDEQLRSRLIRVEGVDTDTLGTFTREIPRFGTQLESARKKARMALEIGESQLGLGSEGAFGPDPVTGLIAWNVELLCFIDQENGLEICGLAQGVAQHHSERFSELIALQSGLSRFKFPEHHLVLRPENERGAPVLKGISEFVDLEASWQEVTKGSVTQTVFVENDLRAHTNPTRQELIRKAGEDLLARISSRCTQCGAPGFWIVKKIPGRPCRSCGLPTDAPKQEEWSCVRCHAKEKRKSLEAEFTDPRECSYCNP